MKYRTPRGRCSVCPGEYALKLDGTLNTHGWRSVLEGGKTERCKGSWLPPRRSILCPGETLAEWFDYTKLPRSLCWKLYGISEETLNQLLDGDKPLTEDLARKLLNLTHIPAPFWLALEHNYRAGLAAGLIHDHLKMDLRV